MSRFQEIWAPRLMSVLRIIVAFCFMQHGAQKLLGFPIEAGETAHTAQLMSLFGLAGIIELGGGTLLLLGLFTRPVAFIASGEMAFAYFMVHAKRGFWPMLNHGEIVVVFCFTWLFFSVAGAGPWSLDALRGRGATPVP
ncbi:MAG: DoxX family protein [Gemmatimonadota bacterium]